MDLQKQRVWQELRRYPRSLLLLLCVSDGAYADGLIQLAKGSLFNTPETVSSSEKGRFRQTELATAAESDMRAKMLRAAGERLNRSSTAGLLDYRIPEGGKESRDEEAEARTPQQSGQRSALVPGTLRWKLH